VSFYSVAGPFRSGPLPNFIIIGVDKAGTTSLFYNLAEHPQIVPPVLFPHWEGGKEIHYFSYHYCRGLDWYRSNFPELAPGQITGEASGTYLSRAAAPERMHAVLPDVKLIVLLGNPIARAMSHFKHWVREDKDDLRTFNEVIDRELNGTIDDRWDPMEWAYLGKGLYVQHLRRWHRFFDRKQFLILKSEDLFSRPQAVLDDVTDFLGIERYRSANAERVYNKAPDDQRDWQIEPKMRACLKAYFRPYNRDLYEYVGRDFGW
jgi:Sulfotransferase domain